MFKHVSNLERITATSTPKATSPARFLPRGSGEARFDTITKTGGRDAAFTGTLGGVPLWWQPSLAASERGFPAARF
jgi:hypothetical protein